MVGEIDGVAVEFVEVVDDGGFACPHEYMVVGVTEMGGEA